MPPYPTRSGCARDVPLLDDCRDDRWTQRNQPAAALKQWHLAVRQADKFHMTGKPTDVMRRLVQMVPPGDLIIDPFAGSGTTGVA